MTKPSRREFLKAGGLALVGFGLVPRRRGPLAALLGAQLRSAAALEVIEMRSDALGSRVWFDPIGLYVEPGATVRWIVRENVHATTAYHPRNDHHPLRIPASAVPWDSGFLVHPGDHFDVTLTVPGVYDYYCMPHEAAGMVGRIIVGAPGDGPGTRPFAYALARHWKPVPEPAQKAFPAIRLILDRGAVRALQATDKK